MEFDANRLCVESCRQSGQYVLFWAIKAGCMIMIQKEAQSSHGKLLMVWGWRLMSVQTESSLTLTDSVVLTLNDVSLTSG